MNPVHLEALKAILGEKGLLTLSSDMAAYETGARYDEGKAAFVARPATTAQTSAVVGYCVRNGIPLIPQSGNTGLVAGSTPDASGSQGVLSLDRLTTPIQIDRVNRSVSVGAGARLSDLNAAIEELGLFFPIDLGADPRLGGMLATNTGGARFIRYGDVRRNTLGLTVVLADDTGTVLSFSSGLRKNNTGIDWKQLFIGTSGAYGIITECVLNVEAIPRQTAAALLVPASPELVPELLLELEAAFGPNLTAFEWMSGNSMSAAFRHLPSLRNPFQNGQLPDFVILCEISRTNPPREEEQSLDELMETVLGELLERETPLIVDALMGPAHEMWALRHTVPEGVKYLGKLVGFDLSFRRGEIMRFCSYMKEEVPKHYSGAVICDFGHVGDGGVHFNLVFSEDDDRFADADFERQLRQWVYKVVVEEFDGSFSAEHGIGRKNQAIYDTFTPVEIRRLAGGLKSLVSPGPIAAVNF